MIIMIMAPDSRLSELKSLVEKCTVANELEKHELVSNLSMKISVKLVELFDEEQGGASGYGSKKWLFLDSLCHKLKAKSQLVAAYHNVSEFVRIQDMVCLSNLFGAIENNDDKREVTIDFDCLARILRQSIHLLRIIKLASGQANSSGVDVMKEGEVWLEKNLDRRAGVGFPFYQIELKEKMFTMRHKNNLESMHDQLSSILRDDLKGPLKDLFESYWFEEFLSKSVDQLYPIERLTVFIAIWIVGIESQHRTLNQLISDLVDEIVHEESNSCNKEELMQLSQVGSFWLSHHRRFKATLKHADLDLNNEHDPLTSSSSSGRSSSDSMLSLDTLEEGENIRDSIVEKHSDRGSKLRRIIDEELLHGIRCMLCDHQPSELLEPINTDGCLGCGNRVRERCCLSYRPVALFSLEALLETRTKLNRLVLVSPNEWARQMVLSRMLKPRLTEGLKIDERVDISDTFERLTVIRSPERPSREEENSDNSESEDSGDEQLSLDHLAPIGKLMSSKRAAGGRLQVSESFRMIKSSSEPECNSLTLCSSDVLLMDSLEDSMRICLVASDNILAYGALWVCRSRSPVSELPLGCDRLFSGIELARLGRTGAMSCPSCEGFLSEIQTL